LITKEHAYESNGSVYFDVSSFSKYKTILQNISQEDLEEEEEEEEIDYSIIGEKKNPKDFALWKKSKEDEPFWESPWGKGRPGWHIECSAMAIKYLGETIDIHGGGQDLKFPHHRNEISQSEAYTGKPFANYFMHNGFVNIDNEKMSKSLGNFFLVSEVAEEYDPIVIRFFLISSHYRSSINYSLDNMNQTKKNYDKLLTTIKKVKETPLIEGDTEITEKLITLIAEAKKNLIESMDDDFNTPKAIAEIMTLFRNINRAIIENNNKINEKFHDDFFEFIKMVDDIFGIFPNLEKRLQNEFFIPMDEKDELINSLLEIIKYTRSELRAKKVYDLSDEIRKRLRDLGLEIEDN
ncbi:MAG: cysteine--tRNA ligase, partial [Promethearchaeota archaeon]